MTSSPPPLHHGQIKATAVADGSSTTTSTSTTTPWSCETNWTVKRGSLNSAVTFESFDFQIDSESTGPNPPLLLVPPSTFDFEPCEIKLNFTQKHEIRQVYVRSTARNYEIYYAINLQSENEYLCTVRCNAASVEENLFPETDVESAISVNLEGQSEKLPKVRVGGENNIGTNEDDWVEIKLPDGRVDEGNTYSPNQNYYEATAEINDSEPCTSLTLRLVSLQSKAFVHVDEIYVFADCIHTDDSQKQTVNPESSAGSSLMTMLVPTLLGLSKSRSLQLPDQHSSKSVEKPLETESTSTTELTRCQVADSTSGKASSDNRPESVGRVVLGDSDGIEIRESESAESAELTRCNMLPPTSDKDKIPSHPETFEEPTTPLLEQLVSRMSRIEDMLLRFEEKMLKPINNIEARLQHVEQQMELLAKNSQPKPENSNQLYANSESEKQEDTSQVHQALTVESQHSEEKQEPPKKYVSVDDALAAALAGFSSLTKPNDSFPVLPLDEQCLKSNNDSESPKPTAPQFIEEESSEVTVDVLNDSEDLTEAPTGGMPSDIANQDNTTEDEIVGHKSIEALKTFSFDKNDILKYFPDQCPEEKDGSESVVDFETCILDVKFACLEDGNLEDFLSYKDDNIHEGVLIEETSTSGNGLLVEFDGDEGVLLQDQMDVHVETSFDSLI